jgi:uncharacterized membrane protein YbhN (UPF0104 family)
MKNKKGRFFEIIGTIFDILFVLILVYCIFIILSNFDSSCIWNNIKSTSNLNMSNCINP